jgi:hypothetical protein
LPTIIQGRFDRLPTVGELGGEHDLAGCIIHNSDARGL